MSDKNLTALFTPLEGWGHVNACLGLAQEMRGRGHRIVFAVDSSFEGKLVPFGVEEELVKSTAPESAEDKEHWLKFVEKNCHMFREDPLVITERFWLAGATKMFADNREREPQFRNIIAKVKPDIIISDNFIASPVLLCSGIPWVWLFSAAPHFGLLDKSIPPVWSGLPINGDRNEWDRYWQKWESLVAPLQKQISDYYVANGGQPLEGKRFHPVSPHLNIYLWPKELEYKELQPTKDNWVRVENFCRLTEDKFEIPAQLKDRSGQLIYLSMGSLGCANLELMSRLTNVLGNSRHKFIVSKGPFFESYSLPDNMWGQGFLPQTAVLPQVDLVITHGGNNTVTEAFHFGKPMLVLPLFGDQYDNGQRIQETGLGIRLNPFHCSDDELLNAVDQLVADTELSERMARIGERIRKSNDKNVVSDLIEKLVKYD